MRVLVTGAGGLLAAAIIREFSAADEVLAFDRRTLDITNPDAVARTVTHASPDVIINCAGYNDVDGAERDATTALRVNAMGVRLLAAASRASGAVFVHYGTDFVFDGEAGRPYAEDDAPNPQSVYAASKLLGEWFALEHPRAYVLRVASLFGEAEGSTRQGSLDRIVARILAGETVPVFTDRTVSPGSTRDIAAATRRLLVSCASPGLYNCVNSGAASWQQIASEAARLLGRPLIISSITLEGAALPARRPKYSALSIAKLAATGITMPTWEEALRTHLLSTGIVQRGATTNQAADRS
jgi:dTDP-4-dehydrorhamnose reductase